MSPRTVGSLIAAAAFLLPVANVKSFHLGFPHTPVNGERNGYTATVAIPVGVQPNVVETQYGTKHFVAIDHDGNVFVNNLEEVPVTVLTGQPAFEVTICNTEATDIIAEFWDVETGKTIRLAVVAPGECEPCGTGSDPVCSVARTTTKHPLFFSTVANERSSWGAVRARF